MSEYLAPGVYVEETSFRSKSIEGVSTSTTGFAGPTRKGPSGDTPELLTSFADFERIYGGLENLAFSEGTNFLAHAVRAYFSEGGSRLYVCRVKPAGATTAEAPTSNAKVKFVSRFAGAIGNGTITVRRHSADITVGRMKRAPEGSMAVVGTSLQALAAKVTGGKPAFAVSDGAQLKLKVGVNDVTVEFHGKSAEAVAAGVLANPVNIPADTTLAITLNDALQSIPLTAGNNRTPQQIVDDINRKLRAGYARLSDLGDDPDPGNQGRLVIGTDRAGASATVHVDTLAVIGFTAAADSAPPEASTNNVGDLSAVTLQDIQGLVAGNGVTATLDVDGHLVIATETQGVAAELTVVEQTGLDFGFGSSVGQLVHGQDASTGPVEYVKKDGKWLNQNGVELDLTGLAEDEPHEGSVLVTLSVVTRDDAGNERLYEGLGLSRQHPRFVGSILSPSPSRRSEAVERLFALEVADDVTPFALRAALVPSGDWTEFKLTEGSDGAAPTAMEYEAALDVLSAVEDISIVAAPGSSAYSDTVAKAVRLKLIGHAEKRRSYRIAVLEAPRDHGDTEVRKVKSEIDSKYAALYYPWVVVANPAARSDDENIPKEISLPPSGFVAGIYARNDIERGVFKAPANEVVRSALRFHSDVNFAQQEVLNPLGINCLRFFPGRGYRVWGARTASSDPEWKYVNVRRYFNYLERSIDNGTQWAVFEPNGERLWANIRETISSFLYNEWRSGALLGEDPKQAYFVRCDRSTMDQNDLDNGRLVCLIGVAVVKPAEFVIFRIGQKTADARN